METKTTNQTGLELAKMTLVFLATTLRDITSEHMSCADIVVEEAFKPAMKLISDLLKREEEVKKVQERIRQESKEAFKPAMKRISDLLKREEEVKKVQERIRQESKDPIDSDRVDMTFGEAIEALKKGYRVSRQGWNGKGMFLFLHERMECESVEGPENVYIETLNELKEKNGSVKFAPVICMKAANDEVVVGWLASQTDMLSNDWTILNN